MFSGVRKSDIVFFVPKYTLLRSERTVQTLRQIIFEFTSKWAKKACL